MTRIGWDIVFGVPVIREFARREFRYVRRDSASFKPIGFQAYRVLILCDDSLSLDTGGVEVSGLFVLKPLDITTNAWAMRFGHGFVFENAIQRISQVFTR